MPRSAKLPDRVGHEANLRHINTAITRLRAQMKNYWTEARKAETHRLQEQAHDHQLQLSGCAVDEGRRSSELNDRLKKHAVKQAELHEIEDNDAIVFKNLPQAQQRLADAELKYAKHNFSSIREERMQVAEIDRLKRNLAKLRQYLPLVEEKKQLDAEIKEARNELRNIRSTMRTHQDQMYNAKRKIRHLHHPYVEMKRQMHQLHAQKHEIVHAYEDKRQEYRDWLKLRTPQHPVATCPAVPVHDDGFDQYDQYELFGEQKSNCNRLLKYLSGLQKNCEPSPHEDSVGFNDHGGSSSDSADEFPDSFKLLSVAPTPAHAARSRKRTYVKKFVKKTMPITHGIEIIRLFSAIDVEIPKTYGEVEEAIAAVDKVLRFYQEHTEVEDWNLDRDDDAPSLVLSTSASERALDSPVPSPHSVSS
ncbi:hypothetical protein M3Y99_00093200 [Aphelenchoides fujianensis]|nr:hypothetical protein M3Y99_00093200 [Aphelenchoides fujianensis]